MTYLKPLTPVFALVTGIALSIGFMAYADFQPTGGITYRLQSSAGLSATTIRLSSFKNRSGIPLTMELMSTDVGYGTIEPQSTNSEFISFTGITQNADGTATLTGVTRGLSDIYPFTASSTLQRAHAGQSIFILSDSPAFFAEYAIKQNDETILGDWDFTGQVTFDNFPITPNNATSSETVAGVVQLATAAQLIAGTSAGSTGGRLVPPNSLVLSAYATTTAGSKLPATTAAGVIDTRFLGTTTVAIQATTTVARGLVVNYTSGTNGPALTLTAGTSNVASTSLTSFTSSTTPTTTWTKRSNLRYVIVEVVGGGGAGGAANTDNQGSAGGGGGGYCKKIILASALGSTETVTVGGGGSVNPPVAGGPSSFGSHCSTTGGAVAANETNATPEGGTATGGDINIGGQDGSNRTYDGTNPIFGGNGGSSVLGTGGAGGMDTTGEAGSGYGAGGGGGVGSGSNVFGGAGTAGAVFVWEVYY